MSGWTNPTIDEFKLYFARDFPFGSDPAENVLDTDVAKAFQQTNYAINQGLFCSQSGYTIAYNLLAAHYLTTNLQASSLGINGSIGGGIETGKAVGNVSQSFQIPQRYADNPYWAGFLKTSYGYEYLQMILPLLTGATFAVDGYTWP